MIGRARGRGRTLDDATLMVRMRLRLRQIESSGRIPSIRQFKGLGASERRISRFLEALRAESDGADEEPEPDEVYPTADLEEMINLRIDAERIIKAAEQETVEIRVCRHAAIPGETTL